MLGQFTDTPHARDDEIWKNFGQRVQHELSHRKTWMRNQESWVLDHLVSIDQKIEIQGPRPPALTETHASLKRLDGLKKIQQWQWLKMRFNGHHRIDIVRLILWPHRPAFVEIGKSDLSDVFMTRKRLSGTPNSIGRRIQIAAKTDDAERCRPLRG